MRRFRVWVLPQRRCSSARPTLFLTGSTLNGHPRFFGYITSSAAPIGALADMLAAALNPNCGAWALSPVATEIERQTVRWIAELIGFPADCGGLLVSGGNVANFVCFIAAARRAGAGCDVRTHGVPARTRMRVYASAEVHTWLEKAADICGLRHRRVRSDRRSTASWRWTSGALARAIARGPSRRFSSGDRRRHGGLGRHWRDRSAARASRRSAGARVSGSTWTARTARRRRC